MLREFEITCPECEGWILLDLETGEVMAHGEKGSGRDKGPDRKKMADAFERLKSREQKGDETFGDAVRKVGEQSDKLDRAFEDAKKKAKRRPSDRPVNPLDDLFS